MPDVAVELVSSSVAVTLSDGDPVAVDLVSSSVAVTVEGGGGVTDHGALTGLGDDDHPQYALADGSRGDFEAAGAVAAHEGEVDPHSQYVKKAGDTVTGTLRLDDGAGDSPRSEWGGAASSGSIHASDSSQALRVSGAPDLSLESFDGSGDVILSGVNLRFLGVPVFNGSPLAGVGDGVAADDAATVGQIASAVASAVILAPTASSRNVVQPTGAAVVPLVLKGAAAQTANLTEWQNSAGAVLGSVSSSAAIRANAGSVSAPGWSFANDTNTGVRSSIADYLTIVAGGSDVGFWSQGGIELWSSGRFYAGSGGGSAATPAYVFGGDTDTGMFRAGADILGWSTGGTERMRLSSSSLQLAVPPRWGSAGNEQTTVGAAGAASALPATPTKYLKVVDSAGTTLVIPAYAAA